MLQGGDDHGPVLLQHGAPAADLLGEAQGHRVLQVGAADLDDVPILLLQPLQRGSEQVEGRQQPAGDGAHRRNMHGSGEGVVTALGHVYMVVGVELCRAVCLATQVGNDLVDVHIALSAAAGLPHLQGELPAVLTGQDLVAGGGDQIALMLCHLAAGEIGPGSGLFQHSEGLYDLHRHSLRADGKVLQTALGLGAPVVFGGNGDFSHGIMFDSEVHIKILHFYLTEL